MKIQPLAETTIATSTVAAVDGFTQPLQSLLVGIASVLITKGLSWLAKRFKL